MFQTRRVEKITTRISLAVTFFRKSSLYGIMWKNMVERGRTQMTK